MKISLIVCSYRPGGIDLLSTFLPGTEGDWELVFIDDYPGRVQRGEAVKYLQGIIGDRLAYYGHSKPKEIKDTKGGLMNAWNTALAHVNGDHVVFLSDYTVLPDWWYKQWGFVFKEYPKTLISGTAMMFDMEKPVKPTDIITYHESQSFGLPKWPWVPEVYENFYAGADLDFLISINGFDERADHCHCWPVNSQIAQARLMGYKLKVCQEISSWMIDHRMWDTPEEPSPLGNEGLWRITAKQSIAREPEWVVPSPNNFNLQAVREYFQTRSDAFTGESI